MKLRFISVLCLLLFFNISAQTKDDFNNKKQAKIEEFNSNYKKKNYKKFEGKIEITNKQAMFDDKIIYFDSKDSLTKSILENGLFYPQMLTEYQLNKFLTENTDKSQKTFLKLQKDPKASFDVNRINTKINPLDYLNTNTKSKRFEVITKSPNLPVVKYFIELTYNKATTETNIDDFIKNAKVTYLLQE